MNLNLVLYSSRVGDHSAKFSFIKLNPSRKDLSNLLISITMSLPRKQLFNLNVPFYFFKPKKKIPSDLKPFQ